MIVMQESLPLSLYHKAKALAWDPQHIDLTQDLADWGRLNEREHQLIFDLSQRFLGGEQAVTHDLAPLLIAIRNVQNAHQPALFSMHDEMFLCAQLFEEAKHVEWFERWWANFDQTGTRSSMVVAGAYVDLFEQRLPLALNRVLTDHSSEALTTAFCTYHMIIEGVLAETGYHGYKRALHDHGLMPGTVRAVELVQRDEARHIAYGIHALQRLLSAQPHLRGIVDDTLNALLPLALEIISDIFAPYGDDIPFGIDPSEFVIYAADQFDARMRALERAT